MKDPSGNIRDWLYGVLYGMITYNGTIVPVWSFPPKGTAKPYIVLAEQAMLKDYSTKDEFITEQQITVAVVTAFEGNDASYVMANSIADSISQIVRQRVMTIYGSGGSYISPVSGFNCIRILIGNTKTDRLMNDKELIIYKSINISLLLEEL
jgi:hypothetical protein